MTEHPYDPTKDVSPRVQALYARYRLAPTDANRRRLRRAVRADVILVRCRLFIRHCAEAWPVFAVAALTILACASLVMAFTGSPVPRPLSVALRFGLPVLVVIYAIRYRKTRKDHR